MGGFLLTVGTSFGYAAGWTPYAADFTRYLPSTVSRPAPDCSPSAGLFLSCVVLEVVGRGVGDHGRGRRLADPTGSFTSELASPLAKATLLAIAIGAIAANAINIYSGAMAFVTIGIKLPAERRARARSRCSSAWPVSWWRGGRCRTRRTATRRSC